LAIIGSLLRLIGDDAAELKVKRIDEGGIDGDLCAVVRRGDEDDFTSNTGFCPMIR
jgi:hypothetical protein